MGRAERYRRYAKECVQMAAVFESPEARGILLQMAQVWLRLADDQPPSNADDQPPSNAADDPTSL